MKNQKKQNMVIQLTPVYSDILTERERARLRETLKHNKEWDHAFFGPETMDYQHINKEFPDSSIIRFPDKYFKSTASYSQLLLDVNFYKTFQEFAYVLITQLDSIVVNEIPEELVQSYDYLGSPWAAPFSIFSIKQKLVMTNRKIFRRLRREIWVGNGGLSIRNVDATIHVLNCFFAKQEKFPRFRLNKNLNEDVVLSYIMDKYGKRIPTLEVSRTIFLEADSIGISEKGKILGFHALNRFNPELEDKILRINTQ